MSANPQDPKLHEAFCLLENNKAFEKHANSLAHNTATTDSYYWARNQSVCAAKYAQMAKDNADRIQEIAQEDTDFDPIIDEAYSIANQAQDAADNASLDFQAMQKPTTTSSPYWKKRKEDDDRTHWDLENLPAEHTAHIVEHHTPGYIPLGFSVDHMADGAYSLEEAFDKIAKTLLEQGLVSKDDAKRVRDGAMQPQLSLI